MVGGIGGPIKNVPKEFFFLFSPTAEIIARVMGIISANLPAAGG